MLIVATISKNSYAADKVEEIVTAGADVLRYNFSHGTPEQLAEKIATAREAIKKAGKAGQVKILADLPGNKIRMGSFVPGELQVEKDQIVVFKTAKHSDDPSQYIPVDFPKIGEYASVGQTVTCGDGEIALEVTRIIDDESFETKVLNSWHISALKGINLGRAIDELEHITPQTLEHIRKVKAVEPDWVAFSFVNSKEYLQRAKELLKTEGGFDTIPPIVSKIESPLAIENLDEIAQETDIFLVARGDLGLICPIEKLGIYQKMITKAGHKHGKKVIVSTQILDSLLNYYIPARADVLDLTNIVLDGNDGIMLAKETGISKTPGYSVRVARKIIDAVEASKMG